MEVRKSILGELKSNPRAQKAFAIVLCVRTKLLESSSVLTIHNYSINKLHNLIGISATTLKKYMPIIIEHGWVHFDGRNNQHLVVSKLNSRHKVNNVSISHFSFISFKELYYSIRAYIAIKIQAQKNFIKRLLQRLAEPKNGKDFCEIRKKVRQLVKKGILKGLYQKYVDNGISYARFAKEIGNCVPTAIRTILFAISKGWVQKECHSEQICAPCVGYRDIEGYTFTRKNNLYIVYANTYILDNDINNSYGMVIY